jgi:hypothetical protein
MRYRITTPVRGFRGEVAGVAFIDSKAEVDEAANGRALAYFRRKGYEVVATEPAAPAVEADEQEPEKKPTSRRGGTTSKGADQ